MERYTEEQFFEDLKRREEREAKEEQERRERTEKASARAAWLRDGGSASAFESAWPQLRDEGRRRRVMDADARRGSPGLRGGGIRHAARRNGGAP